MSNQSTVVPTSEALESAVTEIHDHITTPEGFECWGRLNAADHALRQSLEASDRWARDEQAKRHAVEDQLVVARSGLAEAKEAAATIEGWALKHFSFASECDDGNQPKEADAERTTGRAYRRSAELVLAALNKPGDPRFQPAVSQTESFADPDEGSDLNRLATLICELADHPRPSLDWALCMVTAWHKVWVKTRNGSDDASQAALAADGEALRTALAKYDKALVTAAMAGDYEAWPWRDAVEAISDVVDFARTYILAPQASAADGMRLEPGQTAYQAYFRYPDTHDQPNTWSKNPGWQKENWARVEAAILALRHPAEHPRPAEIRSA